MTSRTFATAVALWAGVAIGATPDTVITGTKTGVSLDTRTAAGAVRVLDAAAGDFLPIAASGTGFATYTDGWSISYSCRGHEGVIATGTAEQAVTWQPEYSGETVLTLAGENADTLTATISVPVAMAVNHDGGELDTTATAGSEDATVEVSLGGVALDTRVAAGAKRTLDAEGGILPLAASGAAFALGGTGDWSIAWTCGEKSGSAASGTAETAVDWQPEHAGENVLAMTAGANTYTATLVVPTEVAANAESGAIETSTSGKTVTTTLKQGGIALDTRVAAGAVRVLSSIDEVLPISYSDDLWAAAAGTGSATVKATSPKGTATEDTKTGEGTFEWTPSDIGDWTLSHLPTPASPLSQTIRFVVAGAGTSSSPYALTSATGFITGLHEGDYVTVPDDAMTAVRTKAERNGLTLVPRGNNYLIVASDTEYTVTWVGGDATDTTEVTVHGMPEHADSTKTATAQYSYTFTGWLPELSEVVDEVTYTAQFSSTVRSYTVKFVDEDGTTVLQQGTLLYGAMPEYTGTTPVKAATAQYTYTFAGWDKTIAAVTGEATYTATYTETVNKYTITWKNDDGATIATEDVEYGATPSRAAASKAATAEYTYTFAGWSPAPTAVTGAATYMATYTPVKVKYTLSFVIDDETTDSTQVEWGTAIAFPANPDRGEWYTFLGWDPATIPSTMPTSDLTFTAQWKKHSKLSYSTQKTGVALDTTVAKGALRIVDNVADILPITYSGDGWTGSNASAAATVATTAPKGTATTADYTGDNTAAFSPDAIGTWTLKHTDANAEELTAQIAYKVAGAGTETAPYALTDTFVDGIAANDYVAIPTAAYDDIESGAATVNFALVPRGSNYLVLAKDAKFTVTWVDGDGNSDTMEVTVNEMPEHADSTKTATAQYSYTFTGWSPELSKVVDNATYMAQFDATVRSYTVKFVNEDGTVLQEDTLDYGATPEYTGETPAKAATAQYTYTFAGWDKTVETVTGAATYTATYTETVNTYTITWKDDAGAVIDTTTVAYGETPTHAAPTKAATAEYSYTFAGWTPAIAAVTGAAEYTATFNATKRSYTITWQNYDGTLIDAAEVEYGVTPTHANPTKEETAEYTYTFAGWTPAVVSVTGAATYKAQFTAVKRSYTITWLNDEGAQIDTTTVEYGVVPTHAEPTKEETAEYTYTFKGWTPEVVSVTGAATYKAEFTETKRKYTIKWKDDEGKTIDTTDVEYGVVPTHADPTKDATAEYTYTFAGWTPAIASVTGAAEYQATFTETANVYTLTWMLYEGGEAYKTEEIAYGTAITAPADPDRGEWYTFLGWDVEEIPATMPAENVTITAQWKKADALRYAATKAAVALDTRVAAGGVREISDASDILPIAASGANFKSASTKGGWSVTSKHLGKVEDIATGTEETTIEWTPAYTGTTTLTLTSTRSEAYTLTATFSIAEEAADNTDSGSIGTDPGTVTVTVAGVALDTRTAAGVKRAVETKDDVLPFALSGDYAAGSDAVWSVTLKTDGGDAVAWASGKGETVKEWPVDAAGVYEFAITLANASTLKATFELSAEAAYGDAAGELEEAEEGKGATVAVTLANIVLDTRTAAGAARNFESQDVLVAELLPFTYSGGNWTPGASGTAVVTVKAGDGEATSFVQATTGEGTRTWTPQGAGTYVFTHTAGGTVTGTATFTIAEDLVYPVDANGGATWLYLSKDTSDAAEWGYAGKEYSAWTEAERLAQTGDITDVYVDNECVYLTIRVRLTETADAEGGVVDWAKLTVEGGKLKVLRQTSLNGDWDPATNVDVTLLAPVDYAADALTVSVAIPLDEMSGDRAFFKVLVTE